MRIQTAGSTSIVSTFNILFGGADEILIQTLDETESYCSRTNIIVNFRRKSKHIQPTREQTDYQRLFKVTASNAATITASGDVTIPSGYSYVGLTIRRQKLGITNSGTIAHLTTSANWEALPVWIIFVYSSHWQKKCWAQLEDCFRDK